MKYKNHSSKERDRETGLSDHGARLYDAQVAVWMSVDKARQHRNLYMYGSQNPINRVDLDGHMDICGPDGEDLTPEQRESDLAEMAIAFSSKAAYETAKTAAYGIELVKPDAIQTGLQAGATGVVGGELAITSVTPLNNLSSWKERSRYLFAGKATIGFKVPEAGPSITTMWSIGGDNKGYWDGLPGPEGSITAFGFSLSISKPDKSGRFWMGIGVPTTPPQLMGFTIGIGNSQFLSNFGDPLEW